MQKINLIFLYALRSLRGGLRGFLIFLGCIVLGVSAISAVNTLSTSMRSGLSEEGRRLLDGDLAIQTVQSPVSDEVLNFLKAQGDVSQIVTLRGMARTLDLEQQVLVEIKAVDSLYPMVGRIIVRDEADNSDQREVEEITGSYASHILNKDAFHQGFKADGDLYGAYAEQGFADRLGLRKGDLFTLGEGRFQLKAILSEEPDKLSSGLGFGVRVMIDREGLGATKLIQPGSLMQWHTRLLLKDEASSDSALQNVKNKLEVRFPDEGWRLIDRHNPTPRISNLIERFASFLSLVGMTALLVGGVGIANAVRSFVRAHYKTIATYRALGASSTFVSAVLFAQIMMIALIGVVIGLFIGVVLPLLLVPLIAPYVPFPLSIGYHLDVVLLSALFGFLTVITFTLAPLGYVMKVPPIALFRGGEHLDTSKGINWFFIGSLFSAFILASLIIYTSQSRFVAMLFVGAALISFVVLRLVAVGLMFVAKRLRARGSMTFRLGMANIYRLGSPASSIVLALGLGLALLVSLVLLDANFSRQLTQALPEKAPRFFFLDIQNQDLARFEEVLREEGSISQAGSFSSAPLLRGRITALRGVDADEIEAEPEVAWILRGDRGITYSDIMPEGSSLTEGSWWDEDYEGEPLVSFIDEEGKQLGLEIGDTVSVNVLGRDITAKIANFREVEWQSLNINFVMVFSGSAFRGAPHAHLATLARYETLSEDEEARLDRDLLKRLAQDFAGVSVIDVRDVLVNVDGVVSRLAFGVRLAASVTLIASLFVLAGALAAGQTRRLYENVVMNMVGATRSSLLKAMLYEYGFLGLGASLFGVIAGTLIAWFMVTFILKAQFVMMPFLAVGFALIAFCVTLFLGLLHTWRLLGQRPATVLREL